MRFFILSKFVGILAFVAALLGLLSAAEAQLRIVTYNTTGAPVAGSGIDVVLKAIGEEFGNNGKQGANLINDGIAKPIDVLMLQEQNNFLPGANSPSVDTQAFVTMLNDVIYAGTGITYAMSPRTGFGDTTQTLIYRTQTVQLVSDVAFGSAGQPRQTLRYQLRPVGYGSNADFYIYNSHYKASLDSTAPGTNANQRLNEANIIRSNSDFAVGLGEGTHAIYAGDHNFYYSDSREPAWAALTAAGPGQAVDPINRVGSWHDNSSFADVHTQSPCTASAGNCSVTGGMDDRFDFQLVTGEFMDGEGLSVISNSYHAFGNNGTTYNANINAAGNTVTFPNVSSYTKSQVLNALHTATDHIPVVVDYQVPAVMQALAAAIPTSIDLGTAFNLNVTVTNAANVVAAVGQANPGLGADELDYSLNTSGNVSGTYLNQIDQALGDGNIHSVSLETSTIGLKSGTISVISTSQGVQNGTINIPVNFLVVLPGDFNGDGSVDAGDYAVWRKNAGLTGGATYADGDGNRDGNVTEADYAVWQSHFGETASGFGTGLASAVPEPSSLALAVIGICLLGRRPTRLMGWTRQS